jgi:hypothetical protein
MQADPQYPIALVTDDSSVEVHASLESIVRSVEEPELPSVLLIDLDGRAFSLVAEEDTGWFDKVLSSLGTPHRYRIVAFAGTVASELREMGISALQSGN